jgi:hypothetical protein
MTTTNNFPSFSDFSRLAMEEEVKKIKGIIAKVNLKYISWFYNSTSSPKTRPSILPAVIPQRSQIILP